MTRNACAAGSRLMVSRVGTRTGRSVEARVLIESPFGRRRPLRRFHTYASRTRRFLLLSFGRDEGEQARVILCAGRAADEVRLHAGHSRLRISAGELELDEAIEVLEALLAAQLGTCRPEDRAQTGIDRVIRHLKLLTRRSRVARGARAACVVRREASCRERRGWCSAVRRERRSARRRASSRQGPRAGEASACRRSNR